MSLNYRLHFLKPSLTKMLKYYCVTLEILLSSIYPDNFISYHQIKFRLQNSKTTFYYNSLMEFIKNRK